MSDSDERPLTRVRLVGVGDVLELGRDDIGEGETLQIVGVLSRPAGGSPPTATHNPTPPQHSPVQIGGGVVAYVIDPQTVSTGVDLISFRAEMRRTKRWGDAEESVAIEGVSLAPLFEGLAGDTPTPQFVLLMRDATEEPGG